MVNAAFRCSGLDVGARGHPKVLPWPYVTMPIRVEACCHVIIFGCMYGVSGARPRCVYERTRGDDIGPLLDLRCALLLNPTTPVALYHHT